MARSWTGPWMWLTDPNTGGGWWSAPVGVLAALDLRSAPQCAATVTPQGFGLFVTPNAVDLGSDYRNLGTDPTVLLSEQQKNIWTSMFALPQPLAANRLYEALWETLTLQASPTGEDRCAPIVPTMARRYELWLAGQRVRNVPFAHDGAEAIPLRDLLKRQYRAIRQRCLDGHAPPEHYRKVLGFWVRKYRVAYRWFQPNDLPDESDLPPETLWTETWPGNIDPLDSPSTSQDQTWTTISGSAQIVSGTLQNNSNGSTVHLRCDAALSGDDNYHELSISAAAGTDTTRAAGPTCRLAAGSDDCYFARQYLGASGSGSLRIAKIVSGTPTDLGTGTSQTIVATKRITANGSTIAVESGGSEVESITDTSHGSGQHCGANFENTNVANFSLDDHEAADLGGGGGATFTGIIGGGVGNGAYVICG